MAGAEAFIQWKNTDACIDWGCPCTPRDDWYGAHFDGYFGRFLKCPNCGAVYEMPDIVPMTRVTDSVDIAFAKECTVD